MLRVGLSYQSCPFVDSLLSEAGEAYERRYELKALGYDLKRVAQRVAEIYEMELDEVFSKGRQDQKVKARSLLCYWAVRELGVSLTDLAREFELSVSGVGYAVERGERIACENNYRLKLNYLTASRHLASHRNRFSLFIGLSINLLF